jgi:ribose transport system ATP-binding protein
MEGDLPTEVVLELRGVSRQFGAVQALRDVSFECRAGEVHALVGENGSGKSTLLGVASGFVDPDSGTVRIGGQPLRTDSPARARKLGLAMAYQDNSLVLAQPVKNNLYLAAPPQTPGRRSRRMSSAAHGSKRSAEPWPGRRCRRMSSAAHGSKRSAEPWAARPPFWQRKKWARRVLGELDLDIELFPDAPAGALTLAQRQLFEVAKALISNPSVLLLDEPTTALGPDEVAALHRTVAACKERGVGVVYVSHRLPEVLEIADRITVLRDGQIQGTAEATSTTEAELVELIVGRPFEAAFPSASAAPATREVVLDVDGLQGQAFGPVTFSLEGGEIVGLAGAEGNGQPQLFDCLAGRTPPRTGRVTRDGRDLTLISVHEALRAGIMLLPGDRKVEALMPVLGVRANATIQSLRRISRLGMLRRRREQRLVGDLVDRLEIRTPSLEQPVQFLSGGNQQKVSVARTYLREPAVILAYEPTQGVDVGSRMDIYRALRERVDAGVAMLVKSSDPLELSGLCDRVLVMSRGTIIEEIPGDELDERRIVEAIVRGPGMSTARRSPLGAAMPKATAAGSAQ